MYKFYMDKMLLPITPSKVQMSIKNKNKTLVLINEGEINVLKNAGLTEVTFDAMLPCVNNYPFALYQSGWQPAEYYLNKLEKLKISKQPFQFIISRVYGKKLLFDTNLKVSLEDYKIIEDAKEGDCIKVTVNLKQYRDYSTKTVNIKLDPYKPKPVVRPQPKPRPSSSSSSGSSGGSKKPVTAGCTVIVNGPLHRDSYGAGPGQMRNNFKGKINFINLKGSHPYHVTTMSGGWQGWVLASAVTVV